MALESSIPTSNDSVNELDARYRSFVKNSTEAIYSIEFDQPIPIDCSDKEFIDLVYRYGFLDNVNDAYAKIAGVVNGQMMNGIPMSDIMPRSVPENVATILKFKKSDFKGKNLESEETYDSGEKRFLLSNASGEIDDGALKRVWCVSRDVTEQKYLEKSLISLTGRLISSQEEELRRLARELHDNLTQQLAVLAIEAGSLEKHADVTISVREKIYNFKTQLIRVSKEVHDLSRNLHPSIIEDLGLEQALESECNNFSSRMAMPVIFRAKAIPAYLPNKVGLALYRIVQEGLKNAAVHAMAKNVYVFIEGLDDSIVLIIRDAGVGFNSAIVNQKPGLGLSSIRERARLVGGQFSIKSKEGRGTSIEVVIPMPKRK
jgi:signal transduction histidine kinase